jgi:hypothetical protein
MRKHRGYCGFPSHHFGWGGFMTVEEEVKMLEKAKEHLESQLTIVNERIEKLKE